MKKKAKKLLSSLFLLALCFITLKAPMLSSITPKEPTQIMPLSDMEEARVSDDK